MSDVILDVILEYDPYLFLLSKREGVLNYKVKNVSKQVYMRIYLKEVSIGGLPLTVVDSTIIDELKPGESHGLEAKVILPGKIPFAFDNLGSKMDGHSVFDASTLMTKEGYDSLPEWTS